MLALLLILLSAGPTAAQLTPSQPGQPARPSSGISPAQFVPPRPNQTPLPTPGALVTVADDELIVDQIQLDKYPRVTTRFTMRPLQGRPVPYLEPYDVMITANGVWQPVLEAHTVGFRGSPQYAEWKRLLHHYYDPFPTVEHYAPVYPAAGVGR